MMKSRAFWLAVVAALAVGYGLRAAMDASSRVDAELVVPQARLDALTAGECPVDVDPGGDLVRTVRKVLQDDRSGFEDLEFSRTSRPCVLEFSIPHESFYQGRVSVRPVGSTMRWDFFSRFDGALNATDRATFTVWIIGDAYAFEGVHSRLFRIVRPGQVTLVK
jgi:hypothetical protein